MERFSVLMTDDGDERMTVVAAALEGTGCRVLRCPKNGEAVLRQLNATLPDALLIHTFMHGIDAAGVALRLQRFSPLERPLLAVHSALRCPEFARSLERLGAEIVLTDPPDAAAARLLTERLRAGKHVCEPDAAARLLWEIGIPAHIKGYEYLREAVLLCAEDPAYAHAVTTRLYPAIADRYGNNALCVERAVRHAIGVAWNRAPARFTPFFLCAANGIPAKPTNAEFIATLAERLRTGAFVRPASLCL